MDKKQEFRKKILQNRRDRVVDQNIQFSNYDIDAFFFTLKSYKTVSIYESLKSEPPTNKIINYLLQIKKNVIVPSSDDKNADGFKFLNNRGEKYKDAKIEDADIIFIPALAVSKDLNRLGKGGGFYDKALIKKRKDTPVFAIIFEDEIFETIPIEEHDIKVDGYFLIQNK